MSRDDYRETKARERARKAQRKAEKKAKRARPAFESWEGKRQQILNPRRKQ